MMSNNSSKFGISMNSASFYSTQSDLKIYFKFIQIIAS